MSIQENLAKAAAFLKQRNFEDKDLTIISADSHAARVYLRSLSLFKTVMAGQQVTRRAIGGHVEWRGSLDGVAVRHDEICYKQPESETVQL